MIDGKKIVPFELSVENPFKEFDDHLSDKENSRILFSAPYGSGKTYFLNKYFENRENTTVIHLYPVNYSIASNADIIENIKADIFLEILSKIELESNEYNTFFALQHYIKYKAFSLINSTLKGAGSVLDLVGLVEPLTLKTGKSALGFSEMLDKKFNAFKKDFNSFKETAENAEFKTIADYLKKQQFKLSLEDEHTHLIQDIVCRERGTGKETVLIIDDLDRIDPEHLFRILNVFSAHFDIASNIRKGESEEYLVTNKFGFDRIIFVCDIKNVRNIFLSKYGQNVDFEGYIDKFYSRDIFPFDNQLVIEEMLVKILSTIKTREGMLNSIKIFEDNRLTKAIIFFLRACLVGKLLTIRALKKLEYKTHRNKYTYTKITNEYEGYRLQVVSLFDFLVFVFGDVGKLEKAIKYCEEKQYDLTIPDRNDTQNGSKVSIPLTLLYLLNTNLSTTKEDKNTLILENGLFDGIITGNILENNDTIHFNVHHITNQKNYLYRSRYPFFRYLNEALKKLQSLGLFNE